MSKVFFEPKAHYDRVTIAVAGSDRDVVIEAGNTFGTSDPLVIAALDDNTLVKRADAPQNPSSRSSSSAADTAKSS
jgi:hypothetical protein